MSENKEFDHAVKLAHAVLDRHFGDPDDDLAVLARQFLRSVERETANGKSIEASFDWAALQRLRKIPSGLYD
jgi:hypothetical protein